MVTPEVLGEATDRGPSNTAPPGTSEAVVLVGLGGLELLECLGPGLASFVVDVVARTLAHPAQVRAIRRELFQLGLAPAATA
eukprot:4417354-Alexandrium_andersonii.AAC.1